MKLGTKVTNDRGWHGVIVERPKYWSWKVPHGRETVYVYWQEREEMMKGKDRGDRNISDPVVSALPENLIIVS